MPTNHIFFAIPPYCPIVAIGGYRFVIKTNKQNLSNTHPIPLFYATTPR